MSIKHCVNCPGRTDHDTADCPAMHYGTLDPQQRLDVARGTGDKVLVEREVLERLLDSDGIDGAFDAGENYRAHQELRALLSEQPQASAAQSATAEKCKSCGVPMSAPDDCGGDCWECVQQRECLHQALAAAPAQPAAQSVMCHGCFAQGVGPSHFDTAGKCKAMQPAAHEQVRAALSTDNQRIVPVEPLLADPHPLAAAHDQGEVQSDDTARLDFMLQKHRAVVVERHPDDIHYVYVTEGAMGDYAYQSVQYRGAWKPGTDEARKAQREAIDAALAASTGQEV